MQLHAYILYNKHIQLCKPDFTMVWYKSVSTAATHAMTGDISQDLNVNVMCLSQCGTTGRCSNQPMACPDASHVGTSR